MSALTVSSLATETMKEADVILKRWADAVARGDCTMAQISSVTDPLLEVRSACALLSSSEKGKREKREKKEEAA